MLAGLEVKVGFGKSWKESLTELSGGQRWVIWEMKRERERERERERDSER